jgi:hypothetical protein
MSQNNALVISPTGRDFVCQGKWLAGKRAFDIMLVNYSDTPNKHREFADFYYETPGFKLEIISKAVTAHADIVRSYDTVWLPDDDLRIETEAINRLFEIFHGYRLALAQPAVGNYNLSHLITKRRVYSVLRYVNAVEMMCPMFRTDVLFALLDTFCLTRSGWGVEWVWSERLAQKNIAVIDAVSVHHTRPIESTGPYYARLALTGISAPHEEEELLQRLRLRARHREFRCVFRERWRPLKWLRPIVDLGIVLFRYGLLWSRPLRELVGATRANRLRRRPR